MSALLINIPVPNEVTIDSAKARMIRLLPKLQEKFQNDVAISDINTDWGNYLCRFSFKAKGYVITGTMTVGHNTVVITGDLPFFVSFFKSKISDAITQTANELMQE